MSNVIEKRIEINASVSRVWRALTDHREFGTWFGVALDGPFVPGEPSTGRITIEGFDHIKWEVTVREMQPERRFSFAWHPYAIDAQVDYSQEPTTLVEFTLEPKGTGTLLTVTETGFDAIPKHRQFEAYRANTNGWEIQTSNIKRHAESARQPA